MKPTLGRRPSVSSTWSCNGEVVPGKVKSCMQDAMGKVTVCKTKRGHTWHGLSRMVACMSNCEHGCLHDKAPDPRNKMDGHTKSNSSLIKMICLPKVSTICVILHNYDKEILSSSQLCSPCSSDATWCSASKRSRRKCWYLQPWRRPVDLLWWSRSERLVRGLKHILGEPPMWTHSDDTNNTFWLQLLYSVIGIV